MAHLVVVLLVVKDMNPNRIKHFFWSVTNHKNMILYAILCRGVLQQKWLSLNIDEYIWFIEMAGWYRINAEIILTSLSNDWLALFFQEYFISYQKFSHYWKWRISQFEKLIFVRARNLSIMVWNYFQGKYPFLKVLETFFQQCHQCHLLINIC